MNPAIEVPIRQIPTFRYALALQQGVKQIMMTTWGGLGDQVCAEPTLRYVFGLFKGYEISCLTSYPDLFRHLPFKRLIKHRSEEAMALRDEDWLTLHTNCPHENMTRDFVQHHFTQVVDFSSLCAIQRQLPVAHREVYLQGDPLPFQQPEVVIHPGRHWPSKTFPKWWWDSVIYGMARCQRYKGVAIIGKDVDEETGTVDVSTAGAMDLRNKLSLRHLTTICKNAKVVITNDSAPLHIAAAGDGHILFVASCKEPDHLMHWRRGQFGWRMQNVGKDGLWNHQSSIPIRDTEFTIDQMSDDIMKKVLPDPMDVVRAAREAW